MQEWGGAEETANGGGRTARKHRDVLRGLQEATRSGPQFQIPGADNDGGGRRLASGGGKPDEGKEELGTAETDPEQGRGGQADIGDDFQSGGSTGAAVRGGDVGATPRIERALDSFMHGAARRITGRQPRRGWDGKWYYPSLAGGMK